MRERERERDRDRERETERERDRDRQTETDRERERERERERVMLIICGAFQLNVEPAREYWRFPIKGSYRWQPNIDFFYLIRTESLCSADL